MIVRKNIIKLLGERSNVYHSALLTTYCFDPIFFEAVYLPTLRRLGVTNVVVAMDADMYDQYLSDSNYQCHRVSQNNYTLIRQENTHYGVFHPKVVLLLGEEEGVLMVGSGNLTYSGILHNDEVWNVFHLKGSDSAHYPLLYHSWKYLQQTISSSSLVTRQIDWMFDYSPWLHTECKEDTIKLASGEECTLLFNTVESTINDMLFSIIGRKKIHSIKVLAPFYDTEGSAVDTMFRHFHPQEMSCIMDLKRQSAPYSLLEGGSDIAFFKTTSNSPLHAKIIEIQSKNETWLLSGSANASTMGLGGKRNSFNDEVCILLHCNLEKNYIDELGIKYDPLTHEERKSIVRPQNENKEQNKLQVRILSCEEQNDRLSIHFSKSRVKGTLKLLDDNQNVLTCFDITTEENMELQLKGVDIPRLHIAVFCGKNAEISNRILIVREIDVERSNPDPNRRKLSRLFDDPDLLQNLSHILGYIEFEDSAKPLDSVKKKEKEEAKGEKEDKEVTKDRFDVLKDTELSISMHSGVRILSYLQQFLFKTGESEQSEDTLLEIDEYGEDNTPQRPDNPNSHKNEMEEADRMRLDLYNYLKRMLEWLKNRILDKNNHGEINRAVNKPCLIAEPGLNAASSISVAACTLIVMMNKYHSSIQKSYEIKELFMKCAGHFIALYGNKIPGNDTLRNKKTRELLKDAASNILVALSFFKIERSNDLATQLILNTLDMWKDQPEQIGIIPTFEEQIDKMDADAIQIDTIKRIREIAANYFGKETPIEEFTTQYQRVFMSRKGFGFIIVDNIKRTSTGWSYVYHAPWFDVKIDNSTATKFKGYFEI